jgi:hypothetical protein
MRQPKLILLSDEHAILDMGESVTKQQADRMSEFLTEAMRDKKSLIVAGEQGWDIDDRRKPDILKRLEKVERWMKRHDKAHSGSG